MMTLCNAIVSVIHTSTIIFIIQCRVLYELLIIVY